MKLYYTLVFLAVAATFESALSDDTMMTPESKVMRKCMEKTNAPQTAYTKFVRLMPDLDETKEGKCFIQCTMETLGMMKEDGSIDNDKVREVFQNAFVGDMDKIMGIWKTCQTKEKKGSDKCENAFMMFKCFMTDMNKVEAEFRDMRMKMLDKCMVENKMTKESMDKMMKSQEMEDTREMRCFMKCAMENMGVMKADGTINNSKTRMMINRMLEGDLDEVHKMWMGCQAKEAKDDLCNYAFGIMKCQMDNLKEKNIRRTSMHIM